MQGRTRPAQPEQDQSDDSREFGFAGVEAVEGAIWVRVWPLDQIGAVPNEVGFAD